MHFVFILNVNLIEKVVSLHGEVILLMRPTESVKVSWFVHEDADGLKNILITAHVREGLHRQQRNP